MMTQLRRALSRGGPMRIGKRVMTTLLLVALVASPAYAGHLVVRTSDIVDEAVTLRKLADGAVAARKLRTRAVRPGKIAPGAVTTPKLRDGAVTEDKIADGVLAAFHSSDTNGPDDILATTSSTDVLVLTVPPGRYVVNAKLVLRNVDATADATVRCRLVGFGILDSYPISLPAGESKAMALQGVVETPAFSQSIVLRCAKGSSDTAQVDVGEDPRLTAIRVGSIET